MFYKAKRHLPLLETGTILFKTTRGLRTTQIFTFWIWVFSKVSKRQSNKQRAVENFDHLVHEVQSAFMKPETLNNVFLTLQICLEKIVESNDENTYKIPHMKKSNT